MANEETVTKVVEGVDELFDQIVVNGQTVRDTRPRARMTSRPSTTSSNPRSSTPIQGEYVKAVQLNNVLHDLKDEPLTNAVAEIDTTLTGVQGDVTNLQGDVSTLQGTVNTINSKIPSTASSTNQLADKNFVNSSVATNTANFLGTYTSLADIEAIQNPTNNDYAFLQTTDSAGNTLYQRYKYSESTDSWLFEYTLNNSSFTAQQWATINSGITGVSDTVQSGDNDPVTSDAVWQYTQDMGADIDVFEDMAEVLQELPNLPDGQFGATKDTGSELSAPVDTVQSGNMHAVTSNAVAGELAVTYENIVISQHRYSAYLYKSGKVVYFNLQGDWTGLNSGATQNLATIPEGYRPINVLKFMEATGSPIVLQVNTNGMVEVYNYGETFTNDRNGQYFGCWIIA